MVRRRRRSQAEVFRLVEEFERSGLGRKVFSAAHGLNVHTLDAWRQRVGRLGGAEKIVPVDLVDDHDARRAHGPSGATGLIRPAGPSGHLRVVLTSGLCVEVEAGYDAAELLRLIGVLEAVQSTGCRSSLM